MKHKRTRWLLSLGLALLFAAPLRAGGPKEIAPADHAVAEALEYLRNSQSEDRAWRTHNSQTAAVTSLAVMAFLSAGNVPGEGRYGQVIDKGIRWVLDRQMPNGLIATDGHY